MCGILGFTHLDRRPDRSRIHRITRSLEHRGPDQQGVYESDFVSLGAVRLRIIDLNGGEQPMRDADGGTVIAFNGEIYNQAEVRAELEREGVRFRTRCDTEVVLEAFRRWDTACFARLRGMFAVALWIERERRLVLARDRMGIKPLYLYRKGQDLYFGSELKTLFGHPEVEREIDPAGLSYYLSLNYAPCPYTLVQGIEKLPPGTWLEWIRGAERAEPYWKLEFEPDSRIGLADATAELDRLLSESVREHLVSDVPLGVWASGGLDSSAVLHYASEASSTPLKTFSVSFRGRSFDESRYFREIAARYRTDHHEFDLSPQEDLAGAIEEIPYYSDEPGADAGALPVWFLSRMTRRSVTVALSGEGADELFGGYTTYLADRYAGYLRWTPRLLRSLLIGGLERWPVSDEKISFEYKLKRLLGGSMLEPNEAHLYWNGTFSARQKAALTSMNGHVKPGGLMCTLPETAARSGRLNRYLWLDQMYYLPDDILYKCDRMSMAHALEVRPPFLDHRIVEFAARLPEHLKIRGGKLKFVLRELMRDKLPGCVLSRPKEGFDIPTHHWLRTVLKPLLLDTINRENIERTGLFRWPAVERLLRGHLERRINAGYHLWGLMMLVLWMRCWNIGGTTVEEQVEYRAASGD